MTFVLPSPSFVESRDTVDLDEIGWLLRRRARVIAGFAGFATLLALLYVLLATPQFTAQGALYLGDAQTAGNEVTTSSSSDLGVSSNFSNTSDVATQLELITATGLVQQAVLETGLNAPVVPVGARELRYWRWRFGYGGRIAAFQPGPESLQAIDATTPGAYRIVLGSDGAYRLFTRSGWLGDPRLILSGTLGQPASGNGVQLLLRPASAGFQFVPGKTYDLDVASPASTADAMLGGALTVNSGGSTTQPTKIAFLRFRYKDPYLAQAFVNQVLEDFIASQLSWKTQSASTTERFISSQLVNISASLAAANQILASYQSKTGIVDVTQNSQSVTDEYTKFKNQRMSFLLQQQALQKFSASLHRKGKHVTDPFLVSQINDTVLAGLTSALTDAQVKLIKMEVEFTPASEDVQIEQAEVAKLQNSIIEMVDNDLASVNASLVSLDGVIAQFDQQIKTMPAESLKVMSLQRSADVLGQLYVVLMQKEQEAEVSKAATITDTRIITRAVPPLFATSPKGAVTVLFGAFVGLVAGLGLVFGQRVLSGRFESEERIRSSVPLHVYGAVPAWITPDRGYGVLDSNRGTPFYEAFRLLRGKVYRQSKPGESMIILAIASTSGDGTTTVAANLAKVLAEDGRKVALVDGDLRQIHLRDRHDIHSPPGIEAMISEIFANLRQEFEFIVLDGPALPASADGMTLGLLADLVLSVVSVSHTPRRVLMAHNELLATLDRPRGIVINHVEGQGYHQGAGDFTGNWLAKLKRFWTRGPEGRERWAAAGERGAIDASPVARSLSDWSNH